MRTWSYVPIMDTTYKTNKVWTSQVLHFMVETTNRVDSEHSALELWLLTCHGDLDTAFLNIDSLIEGEIVEIKSLLEYLSLKEKYNAKSNPILKNVSNNISHLALKKIWFEIKRAPEIIDDPKNKCGHYLRTPHGLVCSCELITYYRSPGKTPAFYCGGACRRCWCLTATSQQKQIIELNLGATTCKTSNGRVLSPLPILSHLVH
ncbi:hypothetical protein M9H77_34973 [Catharanthus roseus]|uniref:Uncharacterized protein n=1 Tax=Catharanthus roseus TaxID=4058 RepID=A0ACB9ZPK0_CATRO|nr:hypothetical protein M9H77_34973 [Catharanthus roseus]